MTQPNLKRSVGNGCNGMAVLLLFAALFLMITNPNVVIMVAVVAVASVVVGTLLNFQAIFEKWNVPNVSFHMKQTGIRKRRNA